MELLVLEVEEEARQAARKVNRPSHQQPDQNEIEAYDAQAFAQSRGRE